MKQKPIVIISSITIIALGLFFHFMPVNATTPSEHIYSEANKIYFEPRESIFVQGVTSVSAPLINYYIYGPNGTNHLVTYGVLTDNPVNFYYSFTFNLNPVLGPIINPNGSYQIVVQDWINNVNTTTNVDIG